MLLQPGQVVDRYRIDEAISDSRPAEVYRVTHTWLASSHALKVLAPGASDAIRAALLASGCTMAAITHPNVVRVTDALQVSGQPAIVMDWVDGPSLADFLADRQTLLDVAAALAVFDGILAGVGHVHQCGVLHLDLKPENVLLARTPGGLVPRVSDFGCSKALDSPGLCASGLLFGTPEYTAPEIHRGTACADVRTDLFALGAILYELLTGALPFDGDSSAAVTRAVLAGDFADPTTLRAGLPEGLAASVRALLAANRNDRPASCQDVRTLLAPFA